jgi:hypothetical protein
MTANTKIATCCYCGTRAALELRGSVRHELACSSCGAPLHDLKMLRTDTATARRSDVHRGQRSAAPKQVVRGKPAKRSRKKRKSLTSRLFKEAFDVIEDIFD